MPQVFLWTGQQACLTSYPLTEFLFFFTTWVTLQAPECACHKLPGSSCRPQWPHLSSLRTAWLPPPPVCLLSEILHFFFSPLFSLDLSFASAKEQNEKTKQNKKTNKNCKQTTKHRLEPNWKIWFEGQQKRLPASWLLKQTRYKTLQRLCCHA